MNLIVNITSFRFGKKYSLFFVIILFFAVNTSAQSNSASINEISSPNDEVFVKTSGLISSGRVVGTRPNGGSIDSDHPKTEIMSIYDKDGQLWYQFSIWDDTPLSIDNNKKKEFVPFTSFGTGIGGVHRFWLRLVAESSHWYEVEINEETRETKYILKTDQSFAKTDFRDWIGPELGRNHVTIDNRTTPLLDAPNGKKIDTDVPEEINSYDIWEIKGDWIRVALHEINKVKEARTNGWVRWRNGRKILVGSSLSDWKI